MKLTSYAVVLGAAMFAPAFPSGASDFSAGVVIGPGCAGEDGALRCVSNSSSTGGVSAAAGPFVENQGYIAVNLDASASAAPGELSAVANAAARTYLPSGSPSPWTTFDSASASFTLDDIVVSGPAGATAQISFNIATAGAFTNTFDPTMNSSASVNVRYGIGSSFGGFGGVSLGSATQTNDAFTGSGAFSDGVLFRIAPTDSWSVRAGDIVSFTLSLDVSAVAGCGTFGCPFDSNAFASSLFLNAAGFPSTGAVANLPAGWTINSSTGLIVDNQFFGAAPVPEPETYAMLAAGLLLLGFAARRRIHSFEHA